MTEKFDKKMTNKFLPRFAKAQEWSDFMTILKKLKENLVKYKSSNMGILTDKISLAKRLAQCLNQKVPSGVHEIALDVYSMLFTNIKSNNNNFMGDNLGLYSAGLFPFFIYASAQNKTKFLNDIIIKHYLTLEISEFKLSLSGMLASILPALEEQNEAMQKMIREIFLSAREKCGDDFFFGTLWSIVFRNKKLRIDCIRYINEIIPAYNEIIQDENNEDENDNNINNNIELKEDIIENVEINTQENNNINQDSNNNNNEIVIKNKKSKKIRYTKNQVIDKFYPNLSVLVLNSLQELIVNSDLYTQRLVMDFIITHFPIDNNILSEDEKIFLMTSALQLLIKNEHSATRRLLIWLMGQNQDEDVEMGEPNIQYMLVLLVKSLKLILKNQRTKDDLLNNIKIIDHLLKQQVKFVDYILEPISIEIILVVQDYWDNYSKQEQKDEVIQKIKNFYIYDSGYLDLLWNSLGKKLNSLNKNLLVLSNNNNNLNKALQEFHSILKVLNFCLEFIYLDKINSKIKYYIPIVSSLLKSFPIFKIENLNDLDTIEPFLELTLKIVKSLQLGFNQKEEEEISLYGDNSTRNNSLYNINDNGQYNDEIYNEYLKNQIKFSSKKGNSLQYIIREGQQNSNIIQLFAENILNFQQKTYIRICKVMLEAEKIFWEKIKSKSNEEQNNNDTYDDNESDMLYEHLNIFKYSTELAILTQEYINANNYNFNFISNTIDIPEWILYLERVIFSYNIDLSLEAINYLLDLFMVSSENIVYDNIKSYLRTEDIDESLINKDFLKQLLNQTHVSKNCLELSMSRLWGLIEDQSHQKPVADLLIKFFIADANIFQNTISNTFAINDIETNVISIKNFSQFWKLTSEFYPEIIFFENGECIFKMLDFLEHEHPLIRHLSKSWLSDAKNQFRKIIDPLLKVLLDKETKWYISYQKQLFFTREYDNRRIIEAFRKLKNIIINVPEISINFFIKEKISQILLEMDDLGKELRNVTKTIKLEFYLELLVTISLRFIQGKFIESVSESFYRENFSVNAASCEFLEFLLSYVEPKNKVMDIAQSIVEPVLEIMMESLKSEDEVMQVQLINLLKVLIIETNNIHEVYKDQVRMIINDNMFQKCIVSGIQLNYIFVRGYFINFVESCLPVFKNILNLGQNLNLAKKLILTNTNFLVSRVKYNNYRKNENGMIKNDSKELNNNNDISDEKYENYSSLYLDEGNKYFILKNYLKEYKDLKKLDENDILVIIKGLKNIIFHFLEIKEVPNNDILKLSNHNQIQTNNILLNYAYTTKKNFNPIENNNSSGEFNWENIKTVINTSAKTSFFSFFGFFSSSSSTPQSTTSEKKENQTSTNDLTVEEKIIENADISNEDIIQKILEITEDIIASLVVCWINSSENEQLKDYCLNEKGILSGDFDEMSFMENTNEEKKVVNNQGIQLKQLIITILWNIYIKYPLEFMRNIIKLFMTEDHRYISKDKQYKLSIIEILSLMKIPTDIFILSITKTIDTDKIKYSEKTQTKFNGYYPYSLNKTQATYEAKLCQLIYSYLIFGQYGISKTNAKIDSKLCLDTWNESINLITILFESKSPMTLFWLYEIINVLMYRFPIKEIGISNYTKKQISNLIINIFNKIYELSINDYYESVYAQPTQIITPLPPSVYQAISYELYTDKISKIQTEAESAKRNKKNNLKKQKKLEKNDKNKIIIVNIEKENDNNKVNKINNNNDALRNFYENMNNYIQNKQIIETDKLIIIYRNIGFICLSSLFYSTMKTLFSNNKMMPHFVSVVNGLLSLIKKYRNNHSQINLDNEIYVDLSTKFLHNLMKQAPTLTYNSSKDKIMEFYLNADFFNMSPKNLILWKDIISKFAQSYNDIINDLISKINQGGGIFFNRNTDEQNIIAMRRLSFIIYSCPKNMYSTKLDQIMEKAKEVITKYCENPTLLNEIFLMLRIMFLRFSNENLIELIRALWPIIFSELVTILTGKRKNTNNELNLGCAKLVELLTISNMEEFCLYQWIFFIDSYNVEDVDIRNNDNKYQLYYLLNTANNCFKPFAFSMAKNWNKCLDFLTDFNSRHFELFQKRSLTLQVQKILNEDELGSLIAKMFTYVAIMNNFRDILDLDSVEHVIENDFLSYTNNSNA